MKRGHNARRGERGNAMVEFALCAAFLVPLMAGGFTLGISLSRAIQVGQVCRDANVLMVRGIDLSNATNQQLVMRTAQGLGMNVAGTYTPDPAGKGVVTLTKIILVGANECSSVTKQVNGITVPDPRTPDTGNCPNYGSYVFASRIVLGNGTRFPSVTGNPAGPLQADDTINLNDYTLNTGNKAQGFPGFITLNPSDYTFVAEVSVDVSAVDVFSIMQPPILYSRNLS